MGNKVISALTERGLIDKGDKIIAGLSGGADSVCLTHALWSIKDELGFELMTAHVNHMIRGEQADDDARFARDFSTSLGINCIIANIDIPRIVREHRISEETAGREARYKFFAHMLDKYGFNKIATAHNLNDSAETVVMNFMRGAGLPGLSGIPEKRGCIIRPLLGVTRAEIEEYCRENRLEYVTDSTNADNKYTRNRVRNTLIPLIESEFNPDFIKAAARGAEIIRVENDFMTKTAEEKYCDIVHDCAADINALSGCHEAIARRVIRMMLRGAYSGDNAADGSNITSDFVLKIIDLAKNNKSGSRLDLPDGRIARVEYGRLIIGETAETKPFECTLPLGKDIHVAEAGINVRADFVKKRENDGAQYFSGVQADKLIIRSRRNGDFFFPAGMNGRKKLKDYFIDEKIPRMERDRTPVIISGDDIVWVVGYRRDGRFAFNGEGIRIRVWR